MIEKIQELINEKALISSISSKDYNMLKRLKEIDIEIQKELNITKPTN